MMKRKDISCCLFAAFALALPSCVQTEEDLFDESAALRINHAVADTKELLVSADNGWIMNYFPDESQQGATFLMKFNSNGVAKVATKNNYVTAYRESEGAWDVISESGALLTFNTYIDIFHLFSDPTSGLGSGLGVGLGGDYEFIVMQTSPDKIVLKGKKRGVYIDLRRLPDGQDWPDYFRKLDEMNNRLFNVCVTRLNLSVNDAVFALSVPEENGAVSHIFSMQTVGDDDVISEEAYPFIITDKGILFSKTITLNGEGIREFVLSDDGNSLVCIDKKAGLDETVNAKITAAQDFSDYFFDAIDSGMRWTLSTGENGMSPSVQAAYERVNQALATVNNMSLSQASFLYYSKNNTQAVYLETNTKVGGYLYFDRETIPDGVTYTFKTNYDNNGKNFYTRYDATDLMSVLSGSFKLERISSALNPSTLKLTNISNPDVWFIVNVKK
ncbi:MAG: DUF4302 domain-containing protein [Prevotella sp.]|nr:DUF4302 domain-containing protein [Prevotella sp.]